MTSVDILNKWSNVSSKFNSYMLTRSSNAAKKLLEGYDTSGNMSVLVLKERLIKELESYEVRLLDLLKDPGCINDIKEMYEMMQSEFVASLEEKMDSILVSMFQEAIGVELIDGDRDKTNFGKYLESVVRDIEGLNLDAYKLSGKPLDIKGYCKYLLVYNTLGQAILDLACAKDGVYLVYININFTADSYFCIFIKSNGNLISFNDRIDEEYPGQHIVLNRRNGRWAEDKKDTLFPYDSLLDYSDYCSKGCASTFRIKEGAEFEGDRIPLKSLKLNAGYEHLLLGILLIRQKYQGKIVQEELKFPDSLIENKKMLIEHKDTYRFLNVENPPAIIDANIGIEIPTLDGVGVGVRLKSDLSKSELIQTYAKGFRAEVERANDLLWQLKGENTKGIIPEYVGNLTRIKEKEVYLEHKQIAKEVERGIQADLAACGGAEEVKKWLLSKAKDNLENLLNYLIRNEKGERIKVDAGYGYPKGVYLPYSRILNEKNDRGLAVCPWSGAVASLFFIFEPTSAEDLQLMVGKDTELLSCLKVWRPYKYYGNCLLDMVDPIDMIRHPLEDTNFKVCVGVSKREYNKRRLKWES